MKRARLLSPWTGDGLTAVTARRPQIGDDFALQSCTDVTGQPAANLVPSPNLLVVEITCDDATMAAIQAHPDYADAVLPGYPEDV